MKKGQPKDRPTVARTDAFQFRGYLSAKDRPRMSQERRKRFPGGRVPVIGGHGKAPLAVDMLIHSAPLPRNPFVSQILDKPVLAVLIHL